MPTPTEVTTNLIQDLMDKGIINLLDPDTGKPVSTDHPTAANLIKRLAYHGFSAIQDINVHLALTEEPELLLVYDQGTEEVAR